MKIFNNDCFDILPNIEDKSIDLIFCDLPYGQTNCKWDTPIDLEKLWSQFKRIRKDTTPIIFTTTTKFGVNLINSNKKEFKMDMVWFKSMKTGFLNGRKRPLCQHEMIYFFWKKQPKYNYLKYHKYKESAQLCYDKMKKKGTGNNGDIVETSNDIGGEIFGDLGKRPTTPLYDPLQPVSVIVDKEDIGGTCHSDYENITPIAKQTGFKLQPLYDPVLPVSVLKIKSKRATKHQTSKPIDLMEFILKYWTNEGDVVFDPTMGGGSMGKACQNLNREFIGCEMDAKIYKMAEEFLNK